MAHKKRIAPDDGQPMLGTDVDTMHGETAYDIGYRHGIEDRPHYTDNIPPAQRQLYSRGYTRGQQQRVKAENPTGWRV